MELPKQSAAVRISSVETPASVAAEADAFLVDWVQNIAVLIPAFDKVDYIQRAILVLLAG